VLLLACDFKFLINLCFWEVYLKNASSEVNKEASSTSVGQNRLQRGPKKLQRGYSVNEKVAYKSHRNTNLGFFSDKVGFIYPQNGKFVRKFTKTLLFITKMLDNKIIKLV